MQLFTLRSILMIGAVCLFSFSSLRGQVPEDCEGAIIICSDEIINFNPNGIGQDDFANPNNDNGCLLTKEREGLWFYFAFRTDMPPNSVIEFTLTPAGQDTEDYDFAIYGPDLSCDSLGSPVRCSFFFPACQGRFNNVYSCPETGLGRGATDVSESKFYYEAPDNDGFVAPMVVQPGEGFYMFIDNFGLTARAFQLEWGGSAAPFLNCLADPICNNKKVYAGNDEELCFDDTVLPLEATLTNATANAQVRWSAEPAIAATFLDDTTSLTPVANIPIGFSGEIIYAVTMLDEGCEKIDRIRVFVNRPDVAIDGKTPFCPGEPNILSVPEGYLSYRWSTGANTPSIEALSPGLYWVEIVDSMGCTARGELQVDVFAPLIFEVEGPDTVCLNEVANLRSTAGFAEYLWSNGNTSQNVFVSGSGIYAVTAVDDNGCIYSDSLQLSEWDPPEPTFSGDDSFCRGVSGTINATPGFVAYEWSTGEITPSITVNTGGVYTVTVTDANTCEGVGAFEITESSLPTPIISGTLNICAGSTTELIVDPGFRNILWSTGETAPTITVNAGGQYSVMVEDDQGCQGLDTVTVTENARPELLAQGETGFCPGESAVLDPGQDFVSYLWSTGATTPTITVDQTGTYGLTVTDANGCTADGEISVVAYTSPVLDLSNDFTLCLNDSVAVRVNQNYPVYEWSDGRTGKRVFFKQAGDYAVTVTDGNGCTASRDFRIDADTLPVVRIIGDQAICQDGSADLSAPAGFSSYAWSTGATGTAIVIDTAGWYRLTVTDGNGCVGQDSVLISQNPPPAPLITGRLGICPGDTTQLLVDGTFADFIWSNGAVANEIAVFEAGDYAVTVTDDLGCQGIASVNVTNFTPPSPVISGKDAFCEGYTSVLQVNGNYTSYKWSTEDDRYLTVINAAGTYSVTVTDANGCEGTAAKTVVVNPRPDFEISGDPRFCPGGQAVLEVPAGYTGYIWSTGNRTRSEVVTAPDYYSVVVRDANNCLLAKGLEVEQNPAPQPGISGDSVICQEGGETTLVLNGNYASYEWSNGVRTPTNPVTQADVYAVTVTDNNNCEGVASFQVRAQESPMPELMGELGFCIGGATELSIEDEYVSYRWSTGATGNRARIDAAGDYSVEITDSLGCLGVLAFTVEEFSMPLVELSAEIDICPDIIASIDGGAGFVSYLWSNGSTDRFLETDLPGFYALTVTDARGCVDSASTVLTPLPKPILSLSDDRQFCPGSSIQIAAETGFSSYRWSNGAEGSVLTTADPGDYALTVVDGNGCEASDTIALSLFTTEDPIIEGPDTLCVNEDSLLSVQQDFSSYRWEYVLNNGMSINDVTSARLRIAGGGQFTVFATDGNGCETSSTWEVTDIALPVFDLVGDQSLCEGVEARVGVSPAFARYLWSNGSTDSATVFFEPGAYAVTVENVYGCESTRIFSLEDRDSPVADPGPNVEFPCTDTEIRIGGLQSSQGPHIRYNWAGPGITAENYNVANPVVTEPGEYFFLVRDTITGCQSEIARVEVIGGAGEYEVNLTVGDNIDCATQTVEIDASRSEKADSLSFQWLDTGKQLIAGATSAQVRVDAPGWYYLETIFEDSRCARIDSIEVRPDFLIPLAYAGRDQLLTCDQPVLQLNAGASSQGIGIAYEWRLADGSNALLSHGQTIGIDRPGQYMLSVTNLNNGCSSQDTVVIGIDQEAPGAVLAGDEELNCLSPTVVLDGSASQSGPDIVYSWLDIQNDRRLAGRDNQLTVSQAGQYALVALNTENGCTDTAFAKVIDNINIPEIVGLNIFSPICLTDGNGFIQIDEVQGGISPYLYSFDGGNSFSTRNRRDGLNGGSYLVVVEDADGCRTEEKVELANGNFIEIDLGPDQVINLGEQVEVEARIRSGKSITDFEWLEPDTFRRETSRILVDTPYGDRTFIAQVADEDGCQAVDTAYVKVLINREVYIPNVFRPDGFDRAVNSRFTVFASSQIKEIKKLAVFDRWGELMFVNENFAPNDIALGWDGTFRNEKAHLGVYVYYCEVVFLDGEEKVLKGDVLLVR